MLELPLPPGADVERTTWGIKISEAWPATKRPPWSARAQRTGRVVLRGAGGQPEWRAAFPSPGAFLPERQLQPATGPLPASLRAGTAGPGSQAGAGQGQGRVIALRAWLVLLCRAVAASRNGGAGPAGLAHDPGLRTGEPGSPAGTRAPAVAGRFAGSAGQPVETVRLRLAERHRPGRAAPYLPGAAARRSTAARMARRSVVTAPWCAPAGCISSRSAALRPEAWRGYWQARQAPAWLLDLERLQPQTRVPVKELLEQLQQLPAQGEARGYCSTWRCRPATAMPWPALAAACG